MNKIFKLSLLFSVMAISLVTTSTKCMDADPAASASASATASCATGADDATGEFERDALEVALECVDRMPDDFSELTYRPLYIVTEVETEKMLMDYEEAENLHYAKTIAQKLAKKYNTEVTIIDIEKPVERLAGLEAVIEAGKIHVLLELFFVELAGKIESTKEKGIIAVVPLRHSTSLEILHYLINVYKSLRGKIFFITCLPISPSSEFEKIKILDNQEYRKMLKPALRLELQLSDAREKKLRQTGLFEEGFVIVNTRHCLCEKEDEAERFDLVRDIVHSTAEATDIVFATETESSKESVVADIDTERESVRIPRSFLL